MASDDQPPAAGAVVPRTPDSVAFVRGLVERGEAAEPLPDGSLPPGATHAIVGYAEDGLPIVKRVRFRAVPAGRPPA